MAGGSVLVLLSYGVGEWRWPESVNLKEESSYFWERRVEISGWECDTWYSLLGVICSKAIAW